MLKQNTEKFISVNMGENTMWMNIETSDFIELNSTSSFLVSFIGNEEKTINDMTNEVCKIYDVNSEDCLNDINQMVEELLETGLLRHSK